MTEHRSQPDIIPFDPSLVDKASGFVGRLAVGIRGRDFGMPAAPYEGPSVHELLDEYESRQGKVELFPGEKDGQQLIAALHASHQLDSPHFVPGTTLRDATGDSIAYLRAGDQPVHLPVANFVYATGFQDWNHGRVGGHKDGAPGNSSVRNIRHHARRGTTPPPIGIVNARVQPNGLVLLSAHKGAHRIAAAHLRRDPTIPAGSDVIIGRLNRNIVKLQ